MDELHSRARFPCFKDVLLFVYEPREQEHYCLYGKLLILACLQILDHLEDKITREISVVNYLRYWNASKMFISLTILYLSLLAYY